MGMQACNLQNLPENYTMKYCTCHVELSSSQSQQGAEFDFCRPISCFDLASTILRGGGPQGEDCRIHPCENVRVMCISSCLQACLWMTAIIGRKMSLTAMKHTGMLHRFQYCDRIDGWGWRRGSWYNLVRISITMVYARKSKLERCAEEAMATIYRAAFVSLHVRKSNRAALALYKDTLGFTVKNIEKKYCTWLSERF